MANKFYEPGEQRAAKVNDLFATIAPRYDFINDLQSFGLHRYWKRKVIKLARIKSGDKALDICCGTGDLSFLLAEAGANVTGLDFSRPMLDVAKSKCEQTNSESATRQPQFIQGDAQALPFADNSFDVVTVGYGLRNLSSWERGLEEMWRVTKPGGRLLVLDFGKPRNAVWRSLYFFYLRMFVPLFGKLFCGDPELYGYILESLKNYPAQEGVAQKMVQLDCEKVRIVNLLGGIMSINYGEKRTR